MTAVLKEQNISRLAISKFGSFEIIYWKESYSNCTARNRLIILFTYSRLIHPFTCCTGGINRLCGDLSN